MAHLVIIVVIIVFIAAAVISRLGNADNRPWPFYAKRALSNPEQVLYARLVSALPEHRVLAQVALSRILGVKKGHKQLEWFRRISQMSADYVICAPDFSVIAVIELDDATHSKGSRKSADARKAKALDAAGIKLIRWNVKSMPDAGTIRNALAPPATGG